MSFFPALFFSFIIVFCCVHFAFRGTDGPALFADIILTLIFTAIFCAC